MECDCNATMWINATRSKDREMLGRLANWSLLSQEVQDRVAEASGRQATLGSGTTSKVDGCLAESLLSLRI